MIAFMIPDPHIQNACVLIASDGATGAAVSGIAVSRPTAELVADSAAGHTDSISKIERGAAGNPSIVCSPAGDVGNRIVNVIIYAIRFSRSISGLIAYTVPDADIQTGAILIAADGATGAAVSGIAVSRPTAELATDSATGHTDGIGKSQRGAAGNPSIVCSPAGDVGSNAVQLVSSVPIAGVACSVGIAEIESVGTLRNYVGGVSVGKRGAGTAASGV